MMKKKILVTGALGHIGSKLIHSFNPMDNVELVLVDNFLTQRYPSLFNLPKNVVFEFQEFDIYNGDLDRILCDVTHVIHLAAITDAHNSFENTEDIENVNLLGTKRVIDACIRHNIKLMFLSTTSVYGADALSISEDCSLNYVNPTNPYSISKYESEVALLSSEKELQYCILRFGTIYGVSTGMRFHTAVNKFCWQAVNNIPLTIWESALLQVRPYLDVVDAVAVIKHVIYRDLFSNEIFNIATDNTTVEDIIDKLKCHCPSLVIELVHSQAMNGFSFGVSTEKIVNTGFNFQGNLEASIGQTYHLINNMNNANSFRI